MLRVTCSPSTKTESRSFLTTWLLSEREWGLSFQVGLTVRFCVFSCSSTFFAFIFYRFAFCWCFLQVSICFQVPLWHLPLLPQFQFLSSGPAHSHLFPVFILSRHLHSRPQPPTVLSTFSLSLRSHLVQQNCSSLDVKSKISLVMCTSKHLLPQNFH